ncbi:Chitinase 2 [Diaporthe australafricana]|uniref:Chitinase 2 n=1 Tax=Diaporthe australafricana TaxID=127596 RepID=A0ABR3VZ19_9PEZI
MFSKTNTITLLAAVLVGSAEAGNIRHSHNHKRADICASKGWDRGSGNYFYDNSGKYNSYSACSAACASDTKCKSFGYSSSECLLFNIALTGNFDEDKSSSDKYYDRGCLSAAAKPSTSSTSTSKTSTTSKTSSTTKTSSTPTATSSSSPKPSSSSPTAAKPSSSTGTSPATGIVTPSSTGGAASTSATSPTTTASLNNPYASKGCPLPTALAVSNFKSTIDSKGNNAGAVKVTYGNGTFSCPDTANHCQTYNGLLDCNCDPDGLTRIITDGRSWLWVQEWYWCDAQEQRPTKALSTLALTANFTMLADYLTCDKASNTCTQSKPLTVPVDGYGGGGTIGFAPIDINGTYLPNCPSQNAHSPIVTNTATCTGAAATS